MTRMHLDRRHESLWRRVCRGLDCSAWELGVILAAWLYFGGHIVYAVSRGLLP